MSSQPATASTSRAQRGIRAFSRRELATLRVVSGHLIRQHGRYSQTSADLVSHYSDCPGVIATRRLDDTVAVANKPSDNTMPTPRVPSRNPHHRSTRKGAETASKEPTVMQYV